MQIVQPVGDIGCHRHRFAVSPVDQFLCRSDPDTLVIVVQRLDQHFNRLVSVLSGLGGNSLRPSTGIAGNAFREGTEVLQARIGHVR